MSVATDIFGHDIDVQQVIIQVVIDYYNCPPDADSVQAVHRAGSVVIPQSVVIAPYLFLILVAWDALAQRVLRSLLCGLTA